jgi:ADP-ribosylglycohydrolase
MRKIDSIVYFDRVYGSWLGRIAGDFVGAPLEFKPYQYLKWRYGDLDYYPRAIDLAYVNDDEMYEICALLALEKHGSRVNSRDIALEWQNLLYRENFTAEKIALQNLRQGISPPRSGIKDNIYYDAIGAQMRADLFGQVAPGRPDIAKRLAMIDGVISHSGIGVEGEIFIATLISEAFFEPNIRENMIKCLEFLPSSNESLYTKMVKMSIRIHDLFPTNFRKARKYLMRYWHRTRKIYLKKESSRFNQRNVYFLNRFVSGVHILPNIGIIVLSLLYGQVDEVDPLGKSICTAAMMGLDTDCNCGNIGAIIGTQLGAKKIARKWILPLKNTFKTYVKGHKTWKIDQLADKVVKVGKRIILEEGNNHVVING